MNNKTTNPFKSLEARTLNYSLLFFLLQADPISRPPFTKQTLIFNCMHTKITHAHTWSKKQSKHEPLTLIISTRVFRYGLFWDHSNSYKPGGSSEPIALRQLAAGSGRRSRTARPGVGGTQMARRRCNLLFWNFCTDQQKVGTYNRLCICPPRWPMMMHPILNRTDTSVLREMWHRSFLDTF